MNNHKIEKICKCGCGKKFIQSKYYKGYIFGHQKGIHAANWQGGIFHCKGYIYIYSPNHPKKTADGYVKRSRLEIEKKIGRYITSDEVVHHINGIKDDDRIENLMLLTKFKHKQLHGKLTVNKILQPKKHICKKCKKEFFSLSAHCFWCKNCKKKRNVHIV